MKTKLVLLIVIAYLLLTACLPTDNFCVVVPNCYHDNPAGDMAR